MQQDSDSTKIITWLPVMKVKSFTLRLGKDQVSIIDHIAKSEGGTRSSLIREAIDLLIQSRIDRNTAKQIFLTTNTVDGTSDLITSTVDNN